MIVETGENEDFHLFFYKGAKHLRSTATKCYAAKVTKNRRKNRRSIDSTFDFQGTATLTGEGSMS